jgi:hypothetical protein
MLTNIVYEYPHPEIVTPDFERSDIRAPDDIPTLFFQKSNIFEIQTLFWK